MLAKDGIKARVLDMFSLKPFDEEAVIRAAKETGAIITAEEHSIYGGLGAAVASVVSENCPCRVKMLGVPDENVIHSKSPEAFHYYGFDYEGIYKSAKQMLQSKGV